jgi:hypothetical protein
MMLSCLGLRWMAASFQGGSSWWPESRGGAPPGEEGIALVDHSDSLAWRRRQAVQWSGAWSRARRLHKMATGRLKEVATSGGCPGGVDRRGGV